MPRIPGIDEHLAALDCIHTDGGWLMGTDVGYHHAIKPDDPENRMFFEDCPLTSSPCWYDGSTLAAMEVLKQWEQAGYDDEVLYRYCEQQYYIEFEGAEDANDHTD